MAKTKNFRGRLDLLAGDDILRPAMMKIVFIDGFAYATNAHVMIKSNLIEHDFTKEEIKIMNGKNVDKQVFAEIYRYDHVIVEKDGFHCMKNNLKVVIPFGFCEDKFPNCQKILASLLEDEPQPTSSIRFDIRYMEKIRKAMFMSGSSSMELSFRTNKRGIIITNTETVDNGSLVLLMPLSPS